MLTPPGIFISMARLGGLGTKLLASKHTFWTFLSIACFIKFEQKIVPQSLLEQMKNSLMAVPPTDQFYEFALQATFFN